MTTKTNPRDDILKALADALKPLTVNELRQATGWAESTIRNNLYVMCTTFGFGAPYSLVSEQAGSRPRRYAITARGLQSAYARNLTSRTRLTPAEQAAQR